MEKLLCERPRRGSSLSNHDAKRARRYKDIRDYDKLEELPKKQRMKPNGWDLFNDVKELNEYLNPLIRFLRSRVGKPWDKVYSEIRKNIKFQSATQLHILQHLEHYVEKNVVVEGGRVFWNHTRWRGNRVELTDDGQTFYVDSHGILRRPKHTKTRRSLTWVHPDYRPPNPTFYPDGLDGEKWEKIEGIWYRHTTELRRDYYGPDYYSAHREMPTTKQLGKKDLKRIPRKIRDS